MKKVVSFLFAFIFCFSMFPFYASADSGTTSEHDEMISLACQAFPEYANRIQGVDSASENDEGNTSPVYESTLLDDYTMLIYQDDGEGDAFIMLASSDAGFTSSYTLVDSKTGTGYVYCDINIKVTNSSSSNVFKVNDVTFTYAQGGTCSISSTGTIDTSNIYSASLYSKKLSGTTSSSAYVKYRANFYNWGNPIDAIITLTVTPTGFTISATNY